MSKTKKQKQPSFVARVYADIANKYFPGAKTLKPGEYHPPLLVYENGKNVWKHGSYLGPGSDNTAESIIKNKPINFADKVSQYHDLAYNAAKSAKDVRDADEYMKRKLREKIGVKQNLADNVSNLIGYVGIAAKNKLEDLGLA